MVLLIDVKIFRRISHEAVELVKWLIFRFIIVISVKLSECLFRILIKDRQPII